MDAIIVFSFTSLKNRENYITDIIKFSKNDFITSLLYNIIVCILISSFPSFNRSLVPFPQISEILVFNITNKSSMIVIHTSVSRELLEKNDRHTNLPKAP